MLQFERNSDFQNSHFKDAAAALAMTTPVELGRKYLVNPCKWSGRREEEEEEEHEEEGSRAEWEEAAAGGRKEGRNISIVKHFLPPSSSTDIPVVPHEV